MNIREVVVNWSTATGQPGMSILHFGTEASVTLLNGTMTNALNALKDSLHTTTSYVVRGEIRLIDDVTGLLTGTEAFSGAPFGFGTSTGTDLMPDVVQGLVRFETGVIRNGRRLKGRSFVPGLADEAVASSGQVPTATIGSLTDYGNQLRGGSSTLRVWSRPRPGVPGASAAVSSVSAWEEWAVQRRRR